MTWGGGDCGSYNRHSRPPLTVIPAQAGIQDGTDKNRHTAIRVFWIPAYAGMTVRGAVTAGSMAAGFPLARE